MATIKSTTVAGSLVNSRKEQKGLDIWFNKQALKFEESRFGWMTAFMTIQSCLGAIAAAFILQGHASVIMLALCSMITMGCNAILIAQGPGKWCLFSFYLSIVVNTILIFMTV